MRFFYRSNSEGCWRATNGAEFHPNPKYDGRFSKGESWIDNCSYETTTQLDPRFNNFLDELQQRGVQKVRQNPMEYIRDRFDIWERD